jgi:tetratricopeptide (TPR) repeat protein
LSSSLLSEDLIQTLHQFALAYALVGGHLPDAVHHWQEIDQDRLPLSLCAASYLANLPQSQDCFPGQSGSSKQGQLLAALISAGGKDPAPWFFAPFWAKFTSEDQLSAAAEDWPLDRSLVYIMNARQWQDSKDHCPKNAKRLALLFPETRFGQQAILYLAQEAHSRHQPRQAWQYLNRLDPKDLSDKRLIDYWEARAGLEMELGKEDKSLTSYATLLEMAPKSLGPAKKLKLALMAQRKGRWEWAQAQLQRLWSNKDQLEPKLQAETLFWLAEGWQYQKKDEQALQSYLRIAYAYPEQNIWSVTAMYRAALIYEQQKKFRPARQLLKAVIDKADQESQKKAAKKRLKAIGASDDDQQSPGDSLDFLF